MSFFKTYRWLLPSLLFTLVLLTLRIAATGSLAFIFLVWNLFLAGLPLFFGYSVQRHRVAKPLLAWVCGGLWLLFFPNALYITTDLFHLRARPPVPLWYDLLLLLSAALNGALYGFLSLTRMEAPLRSLVGRRAMGPGVFGLLVLCGFGIYLGRYLRYNSWDVAANPLGLALDMADVLRHPRRHAEAWALSGVFGVWGWVVWGMMRRAQWASRG